MTTLLLISTAFFFTTTAVAVWALKALWKVYYREVERHAKVKEWQASAIQLLTTSNLVTVSFTDSQGNAVRRRYELIEEPEEWPAEIV